MTGWRLAGGVAALAAAGAVAFFALGPGGPEREKDRPGGTETQRTGDTPDASAPGEIRVLDWEDLMPEGEIDRLYDLYTDYYNEIERQWAEAAEGSGDGPGPLASILEGSAADTMPQLGTFNTVTALDGQTVRLPGYIVPLSFDASDQYTEFLLVPYFGACLHTPPPPPNQLVYVRTEEPATIDDIWEPFWVEGVMATERKDNDLGNAAYTLALTKLEAYAY